jgi:prefoldin alpha subunit
MEIEKNSQELMMKASMIQQKAEQIQQQLQSVEQSMQDISIISKGLDDLIGSEGKEIKASIGKGIFIDAKLMSEELTVDIGNRNFVRKSIPETKKLIENQMKKLENVRDDLNKELDKINSELIAMITEVEEGKKV